LPSKMYCMGFFGLKSLREGNPYSVRHSGKS
jgi:hypothetical protein